MDGPKKENLSKVVLNVTTFKRVPETNVEYPVTSTVDITDALVAAGFDLSKDVPSLVNGITQIPSKGVPHTHFVVPEQRLLNMRDDIHGIVTAAIVNTKQLAAVQNLIRDTFDTFRFKLWEQIRNGDVI